MVYVKFHTIAVAAALLLLGVCVETSFAGEKPKGSQVTVYIGTYTQGGSQGIYRCQLDLENGQLTPATLVAETENPTFLAIHPSKRFLYAANETGNYQGKKSGAISAFAIDAKTGDLTFLNKRASRGGAPCHLVVDATGKNVLAANYSGGSVICFPITKDGHLQEDSTFVQHEGSSVNPRRQKGPHAHSINIDAGNRFAMAADLGLDKILVYRFDAAKGTLIANDPPSVATDPGGGPRHLDFHPNGRFAYTNNEITSSVTALSYDAKRGVLKKLQTLSTLPKDYKGNNNSTAQILVHSSGKFVYVSNRGHDSVAAYAVDEKTGKLTSLGNQSTLGETPRNFNIDPSGKFLLAANQSTGNIAVFRIDQKSGQLKPTGHGIEVPRPVCIKFLSATR